MATEELSYRMRPATMEDMAALRQLGASTLSHPDGKGRKEAHRGAAQRGEVLLLERYDSRARDWRVAAFVDWHIRVDDVLTIRDAGTDGDAPHSGMISGFDPVRREIARIALTKLVADGRIHPQRIEEVVAKATQEVEEGILKAGEEAALEAGVHGLHPEVLKVFGRMKYRTSYGQNQLRHSVEAAQIARILAAELGADEQVATRATLLHDLGKVMSKAG